MAAPEINFDFVAPAYGFVSCPMDGFAEPPTVAVGVHLAIWHLNLPGVRSALADVAELAIPCHDYLLSS